MKGPLPAWLAPVTMVGSAVYGLGVRLRNHRYARGRGIDALDVPVISVGNITAGGVGKTPMVRWIVERLRRDGRHPLIGMRGYGAKPGEVGDEEAEYRALLPGVPIVANPHRYEAIGVALRSRGEVDVVVLDDAFQHRRLHRDVDLVLIDGRAGTMDDRLLPRGWLREPLAGLARADGVVVTHARAVDDDLAAAIERVHGRAPIAWCDHGWVGFDRHGAAEPSDRDRLPVSWVSERRVATLLGIGRPERVRARLAGLGAAIAGDVPARDHQRYDASTVAALRGHASAAEAIVMTGKDWVKIEPLLASRPLPIPVLVPRLALEFVDGELALASMIEAPVS